MLCAILRADQMRLLHCSVSPTRNLVRSVVLVLTGALMLIGGWVSAQSRQRPPTLDPTYGLRAHAMSQTTKPVPDAQWIWAATTTDNQKVYLRGTVNFK